MAYKDIEVSRAAKREHYRKNKEAYTRRARQREQDMLAWVREIKGRPCMDCGGEFSVWVMDLDHRDPATKSAEISQCIRNGNWTKLREEVAKCDVVCANCHRERTAKMFGWELDKMPLSMI